MPDGVQGYDRYAYVNNDPIGRVDPTGHYGQCRDGDSNYKCNHIIPHQMQLDQQQALTLALQHQILWAWQMSRIME